MRVVSFEDASGHRLWQLAFRNLGATCSLHGFSRVVLLAKNGRQIPGGFRRETGFPASTVTLEPGESAFVAFTYLDGRLLHHRQLLRLPGEDLPSACRGGFLLEPDAQEQAARSSCAASPKRVYPVTPKPGP